MSDTPETDSVIRSSDETPWTPWVCAGHAKRLERERDDARKEWDVARDGWSKALEERDEARRELDEAKSIISRLVSRKIISWGEVDSALEAINEEKEEAK